MQLFELEKGKWFYYDKGHFLFLGCDGMYGKCLLGGEEESLYFLPCFLEISIENT